MNPGQRQSIKITTNLTSDGSDKSRAESEGRSGESVIAQRWRRIRRRISGVDRILRGEDRGGGARSAQERCKPSPSHTQHRFPSLSLSLSISLLLLLLRAKVEILGFRFFFAWRGKEETKTGRVSDIVISDWQREKQGRESRKPQNWASTIIRFSQI